MPGEITELAQRIKDAVHGATGLSCSIGIAANKLLAKIASELQKPDGLTVHLRRSRYPDLAASRPRRKPLSSATSIL